MEKPVIDYENLLEEISDKCLLILQEVNEHTVSRTLDAVKERVEIAVERYSYGVSDYWMKMHADLDISRRIKFTDVDNGYEILMKKWVRENPLKFDIPAYPKASDESYDAYLRRMKRNVVIAGAVGTVAVGSAYAVSASRVAAATAAAGVKCAKGYYALGHPVVAISLELAGLAVLYAAFRHQKNVKAKEMERERREMEEKLDCYKQDLVKALCTEARAWTERAVAYSDKIGEEF